MRSLAAAFCLLAAGPAQAQEQVQSDSPRVLTLDDALIAARRSQPQLLQARAGVQAAAARADQARSGLLPQLTGNAGYQRGTANFALRPGSLPAGLSVSLPASSWSTSDYWNFGTTASELLWDFGHTVRQWEAAKASVDAQGQSAKTTLSQVVFNVESAFFGARAQKALVGVARETLENQERHLAQIKGYVEVGTRPEIDLAQARTDRANSQVQLVTAENGYETGKAQLNNAMGIEGPTDYEVADDALAPVDGEDLQVDALLGEALKARPEFASLAAQTRAQQLTTQAIQGTFLPSLNVSTGFTDAGEKVNNLAWNWSAALNLSWSIFSGGLTRGQVDESEANLKNLEAQSSALHQQVRLEVDQARVAVRAAKATLAANEEALINARERLRLAEGRYQTGLGNALELSDAQLALTNAQGQHVQADFNLSTARAQLLKALGRR
jgi:outer membrane protein